MITILVEDLIQQFKLVKDKNPLDVNELLDYIQKSYIDGELCIVEYKKLFFELDKRGAQKPESFLVQARPFSFETSKLSIR
ncbi:YppF family protein [Peribacillus asahii]|uniref:YppF family protein n=1 Tax=Peribacillus asahii TaxID=228899 RepID=UPI002079E079|nr:YppF family protein [Peribacillus asahii]USK72319.1 YppF family protein [Peribacillus asahii]